MLPAEDNLSFISIIIPCRNEEKYTGKCLDSIIMQDYPKENLEVLVIDGASEDKTREIVQDFSSQYPFIKLLTNPQKFTPFALNIGIKAAKGEIIVRMDAHAGYEKDYVSKCVAHLMESGADNVGGAMKTLPAKNTLVARAVAYSLASPFGAASDFRVGSKAAKSVDTVFGGCYRREIFDRVGLFNENLAKTQDMEFNIRLKRAGGKILLVPEIVAYYYPKSNLKDFFLHNFEDGIWAIYPLKFVKIPLKLRHYIPLIFVSGLLGTGFFGIYFPFFLWLFFDIIILYFLVSLYFSLRIAIKEKDLRYLFLMPITFAIRHFSYGLGSIWGLLTLKKN